MFWNAHDLERKLAEFQVYYNAARSHASLDGHMPLTFVNGQTVAPADLRHVRWVSHCRDLVLCENPAEGGSQTTLPLEAVGGRFCLRNLSPV